jgi:hypothetical protein
MKFACASIAALCSLASLAYAPQAQAGHTIRADLPCPFGGGGSPGPTAAWVVASGASPFNPGGPTTNPATLSAVLANLPEPTDEAGLTITAATQYDWYTNPIPSALSCTDMPNAPGPIEQVIDYTLAGGSLGLAAGDTEVEFNYDGSLNGAKGTASFVMGGVTYTSAGTTLPTGANNQNDFIFSKSGALVGALVVDPNSEIASINSGVPTGWTASGGGGGGTVTAPEIDPTSAIAALTLLAGGLAVLRGGRRTLLPVR